MAKQQVFISKIKWSKVTWYSKSLAAIFFVGLVCGAFYFGTWYERQLSPVPYVASFDPQEKSSAGYMLPKKAGAFHFPEEGLTLFGTTDISGTVKENEMLGKIGFTVIDTDVHKIPQIEGLYSPTWFCFSNDAQARAALAGKTGVQTIKISNYHIDRRPTETCDQTEFIRIVGGQ